MDKKYEQKYHRLEKINWWFKARRDIVFELIKKADRKSKILEIGCSGGPFIQLLQGKGFQDIYGIDISRSAIDLCKQKGIKNVYVMDAVKTTFKDDEFDIIIASDVLEHIKDKEKALKEWNRILKPGGKLVVFVPAFQFLWSHHDDINQHYRRYNGRELKWVVGKAGFQVVRSSYWNFLMFFTAYFLSRLDGKSKRDYLVELNPVVNNILLMVLKLENLFLRFFNLPFGVSVFAVAKK